MKLLLLLSDEAQLAHRRDAELKVVQEGRNEARAQVSTLLDQLLGRSGS
jgi:mediator of RNA polymerase II transcription subunit 22